MRLLDIPARRCWPNACAITAGSITVAGSAVNLGNCTVSATNPTTITTGMTPVSDPLASLVTAPTKPGTCTNDPKLNSSTTIGPSGGGTICYNSLTISGGTITLNPGVYYINGNLNISGSSTLNGTGVTFYVTCNGTCASNNGYISIQGGNVALNISAPTSGSYKGLLFYQNSSDPETATFGGGATGNINGFIYLPGAGLTLTGNSGTTFNVDLITQWINLTGSTAISPYAPLNIPSPIPDPVLAE